MRVLNKLKKPFPAKRTAFFKSTANLKRKNQLKRLGHRTIYCLCLIGKTI
jgi:hypothetical protein